MKSNGRIYRIWNGYQTWTTWAVSEAKAVSNIEHRMRSSGMFVDRSKFVIEEVGRKS